MNLKEQYILENDAVLLRPMEEADYDYLLEYAVNEPEIWKYNFPGAGSPEKLKAYIGRAIAQRDNQLEYPFIVYDKIAGRYVGSTRFYNIRTDYKTLEIGYTWYGKDFQGTGLNKHCKYLLLEFVFEKLGWERVGFAASNLNERSKNAMKSIGCIEEGVLRNASIDAVGERIDVIVLGILRSEWFDKVKTDLRKKMSGVMRVENSTMGDIDSIFALYRIASDFMKARYFVYWPEFERTLVETEIAESRQWKLVIGNITACIWATTFDDPQIWEERNTDPSIYIHRIATKPDYRGRNLVSEIVAWAKKYAAENGKKFIRMDTVGENKKLIEHYTGCGFNFLGLKTLKDTSGLPQHYELGPVCLFELAL